jgi:hypothetical protein
LVERLVVYWVVRSDLPTAVKMADMKVAWMEAKLVAAKADSRVEKMVGMSDNETVARKVVC